MKIQDYNNFYDTVIHQCIKGIKEQVKHCGLAESCIIPKKYIKKKIYYNYQKKRDFIISNYMSKQAEVSLDRHKVASCMVYAILKTNPLKVDRMIPGLPEKILLSNEYLAFFVALNIIEMYKIDETGKPYQIIIPKTYHEDGDPDNTYESNLCKSFYFVRMDNINKFDIFAYSDIFFFLEKYTDMYLKLIDKTES